jgi:hypothetical protein
VMGMGASASLPIDRPLFNLEKSQLLVFYSFKSNDAYFTFASFCLTVELPHPRLLSQFAGGRKDQA